MSGFSISVVMRSCNDESIILQTLQSLQRQTTTIHELIIFDNASVDRTVEIIKKSAPLARMVNIPKGHYKPGKVLNQGAQIAQSELVVFLNSDAIPTSADWLETLVDTYQQHRNIVFGRQVPRKDARNAVARDYSETYPAYQTSAQSGSAKQQQTFSIVNCLASKETFLNHPFPEDLQYSEDTAWHEGLREKGMLPRYCCEAVVEHSHNYNFRESTKRFYNEGLADAHIFKLGPYRALLKLLVSPARAALAVYRDTVHLGNYNFRSLSQETGYSIQFRVAQKLFKPLGQLAHYLPRELRNIGK